MVEVRLSRDTNRFEVVQHQTGQSVVRLNSPDGSTIALLMPKADKEASLQASQEIADFLKERVALLVAPGSEPY